MDLPVFILGKFMLEEWGNAFFHSFPRCQRYARQRLLSSIPWLCVWLQSSSLQTIGLQGRLRWRLGAGGPGPDEVEGISCSWAFPGWRISPFMEIWFNMKINNPSQKLLSSTTATCLNYPKGQMDVGQIGQCLGMVYCCRVSSYRIAAIAYWALGFPHRRWWWGESMEPHLRFQLPSPGFFG